MDIIGIKDVAIMGRQQNVVVLQYDRSILITSDILKHNDAISRGVESDEPHITIDAIEEKIDLFAKEMLLASTISGRTAEPLVYGDALVDLLKWMIDTLKTHSHPPNAPAIPDFHSEANSRLLNMDYDLLNKQVKHR